MVKRNGQQEPVSFNAIYERVAGFCYGLDPIVDPVVITQKVVSGVYNGVTTQQLDELSAGTLRNKIVLLVPRLSMLSDVIWRILAH